MRGLTDCEECHANSQPLEAATKKYSSVNKTSGLGAFGVQLRLLFDGLTDCHVQPRDSQSRFVPSSDALCS